ncbi:unnamed protein product [Angiostrongylus costaricensis]|uniref:Cytochrome P450 n=1 Tax=Angiostrongylus costaricensis TaxID=334426 RepID=A0A0R3P9X4_ANGCS|nr:unnamed protein product [Angiostrongylus costaricensis]
MRIVVNLQIPEKERLAIVLILWRFVSLVTQQELTPMDDYRLYRFGDYLAMHKRVPSAGDMMVRFGKRSL